MLHQAKWFGLSLTLHLAVATGLTVAASRNLERTPKAIMVVLDNFALPDLPRKATSDAVTRLPAPAKLPEQAKPELTRQVLQPAALQVPLTTLVPEQNRTRDLSKAPPEMPVVSNNHPRVESVIPAPPTQAKMPVQHSALATEERPAPEKVVKGDPVHSTWNREDADGLFCGMWQSTPGAWKVDYAEWEYIHIHSGYSILTKEDGTATHLRKGDSFIIRAGFKGMWEVVETTLKDYVILG